MATIDRRQFLRTSITAVGASLTIGVPTQARVRRVASDQVALGKSGVTIARLGLGTGSSNGQVQRDLGMDGFRRLIHEAFDRGITYIDTADNYKTHEMVREAIKGLPREKLFIQSKMPWDHGDGPTKPAETLERYRRELGTEYIDSLLLHCATKHTWPADLRPMMNAFDEAKAKGIIRLKGVSCHGLPALTAATDVDWCDVHLARVNAQGHHMDGAKGEWSEPGNRDAAMKEIAAMHAKGRGIIGMKLVGNGDFKNADDRERALKFAMTCGCVDAVVMGFASVAELDEAIGRMNRILAEAA
jgi:predicted aldo/keto reductase-like oxidoreductase